MLGKNDFPKTLAVDLEVAYSEGRTNAPAQEYRQLIQVEPTTSSAKVYVFYGDKGRLQRFRTERQDQEFFEYKQTLTLDKWEMTEVAPREVLDDDQSGGILRNKVGDFGRAVEDSLKMETEEFLRDGVSILSFDGTPFFNPVHVYTDTNGATHGTAWSNINWGGSQVDSTTVQKLEQHFAELKSDTGKVLGGRLTHLGVKRGSANHKTAREIANSQFTVEASTVKGTMTENIFRGAFDIIPMDYGIGASEWYGFDLSGSAKPVIVLSHIVSPGFDNLEYTSQLTDSNTGFWRDQFAWGVLGRFDWNPGDPRTAYLNGSSSYSKTASDLERQRIQFPNA